MSAVAEKTVSNSVRKRDRDSAVAMTSSIDRMLATGNELSSIRTCDRIGGTTDMGSTLVFTATNAVRNAKVVPADCGSAKYNSVPAGLSIPPFFTSSTTPMTVNQGVAGPCPDGGRTRCPIALSPGQKI